MISDKLLNAYRFHRAARLARATVARVTPPPSGNHRQLAAVDCLALARADVAAYDAAMAEGDTSKAARFRRHASSVFAKSSGHVGGATGDSVRWVEKPNHVGLRFVGYYDKLASIDHTGWFTDPEGFGKMRGVVYQLPGRNGVARFVAAYDNEDNGAADCGGPARVDFGTIYETDARAYGYGGGATDMDASRDAAYAADSLAEREAESEREYQTAWRAGSDWAQDKEEAATIRQDILETLAARRKVRSKLLAAGLSLASREWARACATFRESVDARLEALREVRQRMQELAAGDHGELIFYPSEALRGAFNDGAGETVI